MTEEFDDRSLVLLPVRSLANATVGATRILSEMIGETLALGREERAVSKPTFTAILMFKEEGWNAMWKFLLRKRWKLAGSFDLNFNDWPHDFCGWNDQHDRDSELVELVGSCLPDLIVAHAYMVDASTRRLFRNLRSTYGVPIIAISSWPNPDLEIDPEEGGLECYIKRGSLTLEEFDDHMERCMTFHSRKYPCKK